MPGSSVRIVSPATTQHPECSGQQKPDWASVWARVAPFAIIFLASAALFFGELGKYPLFNPDEALYAEPAREMLEIGDYITTYLNYAIRFTKPPIAIWGQALGILAFGCNEFAVRFFGAASGALLVAASYWFTERILGRRAAIVASSALATAPLFIGTAREAITDMPLSLFSACGMFCFYLAARARMPRMIYAAYICTGLAVMTKGPVGVVLPVAILSIYHVLRQDWKEALKFYKPIQGLAIVALIALPWFALEIWITRGAYFNDFIMRENFQRFTSVVDSHKGAWWYHIAALMGGYFPWSVFIPQALFAALMSNKIRDYWKNSGPFSILHSYRQLTAAEDLGLYCAVWTIVTVSFFSLSVSKLLPYTLPAFPAVAVLIALEMERIIESRSLKRSVLPAACLTVSFAAATLIVPLTIDKLRDAPATLSTVIQSFASFELIFAAAAMAIVSRKYFRTAFFLFFLPTFVGFLFFGSRILGILSSTWEEPLPTMARFAACSDLPILVYDMRKPSMPFYTRRQVIQPSSEEQLLATLKTSKGAYILSKSKRSDYFRHVPGCHIQMAEGKFILVQYRPPIETKSATHTESASRRESP
ncbi:MAG: glycosyltransferase family 39 protein [Candidatus Obscuribacterales bacterium]|nr:glycosyltransferase family 39 protein [Candidatus Obscuribacterales bacterium]